MELYQSVNLCSTFEEKCNFALCLYNMRAYEEAFSQYEQALEVASTEGDKSHVYAAMGMVKYQQGKQEMGVGDIEGAKTQLFKWSV